MEPIYLDNAATTRLAPAAATQIARANDALFYNSAALYPQSVTVKNEIDRARRTIQARLDKAMSGNLIFTSGATESNNTVIAGVTTPASVRTDNADVLVLAGEHSSVHAAAQSICGKNVREIHLNPDGTCNIAALCNMLSERTALVIYGLVNSDTGTIQDHRAIAAHVRKYAPRAHIHCDATQAFCKIPFSAMDGFDTIAMSAHKIGGPKGIGALWVRRGINIRPLLYGGGQQPIRPGTENTPAILGFAAAVETWDTDANFAHVSGLHTRLITNLPRGVSVNGINNNPYITNLALPGIMGQTVMNALADRGILVGLGSACASKSTVNRTLVAMGIPNQKTKQVLRISFSPQTQIADVDTLTRELETVLASLK